jgi:hypothetical protein
MTYKIEVCIPVSNEWVLLELIEASIAEIKHRIEKIKQIYPDYLVRALDVVTARTVACI